MNKLLSLIGLLVLAVAMMFVDYWMLQKIYNIVLVPHGAPTLTLLQLWGVGLFLTAMVPVPINRKKRELSEVLGDAFSKTLGIALLWGLAYLVFG